MKLSAGSLLCCGLLLLYLTATSTASLAQTTYYIAATGNDANTGRSAGSPFRSLGKVNSLTLMPGDTVLFRRGDTFRGSLVIRRSGSASRPITFDAYGHGPKPILAGSVPINNWTSSGVNTWQAPCPDCGSQVTGLYRNGVALPLGRYPNPDAPSRGYLTVQAHSGTTQLTSQQPLTTNWTGGEVVVRPTYWIIDRAPIAKQTGNTLTLANPSTYPLTDGWGYFIQNHRATLDQTGEWYYDPARKMIQLYDDRGHPNQQTVTATTVHRGIDMAGASFITLRHLHVTETLTESLFANNVSNLTLTNTDFTNAGEDGLTLTGTGSNILIENSRLIDINNNGVRIGSYQNVTLRGSTIRRVGLLPGQGKSGDGQFNGIQSTASNTLIENNVVDSIGYNGITFWNNTTIRQNTVSNFCTVKCDGGGIYVWNGSRSPMSNVRIVSNIIQNGIGTGGGTADSTLSGAHGIFLDDCAQGVDVVDNTITNCHGLGLYLHGVSTTRLIRNTCFNNSVSQLFLYNNNGPCQPRQNLIHQNIFLSTLPNHFVVGYSSSANDLASYGLMSQNYYARPFDDAFTIRAVYNNTIGDDLALPQWQAEFGHDLTSKTSPITYKDYTVAHLDATNRINCLFDESREGWDTWSPYANGRATWDNTNQLDKGSLRIDFSSPTTASDSHVLVYTSIQAVIKKKSYLLQFDAVAPTDRKVEVFIRQRNAPYQDVTRRYTVLVGPARKRYELAFTASTDEANALLTFQTRENAQPVWLDNVRLQDAAIHPVNPADYVRLVYNPTKKDSLITLSDNYRDVKNHYYGKQVMLKPYTSVILLKDSSPPVDVQLSLQVDQKSLKTGDIASVSLRLHNESSSRESGNQVEWACQIPANLIVRNGAGLQYVDGVLTGTVHNLTTDTTVVFQVQSAIPGTYSLMAQVTATTYGDPDSTPGSGTEDDEDDMAQVSLTMAQWVPTDTAQLVTSVEPPNPVTEAVSVFPNPTAEGFTFLTDRAVQTLTLIDELGRQQMNLHVPRRSQPIRFGEQLPAGVYLLRIQYNDGGQRVMKLLKAGR